MGTGWRRASLLASLACRLRHHGPSLIPHPSKKPGASLPCLRVVLECASHTTMDAAKSGNTQHKENSTLPLLCPKGRPQ